MEDFVKQTQTEVGNLRSQLSVEKEELLVTIAKLRERENTLIESASADKKTISELEKIISRLLENQVENGQLMHKLSDLLHD